MRIGETYPCLSLGQFLFKCDSLGVYRHGCFFLFSCFLFDLKELVVASLNCLNNVSVAVRMHLIQQGDQIVSQNCVSVEEWLDSEERACEFHSDCGDFVLAECKVRLQEVLLEEALRKDTDARLAEKYESFAEGRTG